MLAKTVLVYGDEPNAQPLITNKAVVTIKGSKVVSNIQLCCQPPNISDWSSLNLELFNAILLLKHQIATIYAHQYIQAVSTSSSALNMDTLNNVFF